MDITALILTLIIGGVAGWLAGLIIKGYGYGLVGNFGVALGSGIVGAIVHATIGAVILLLLIRLIKRA